jgi:hypothetical protein
MIYASQLRWNPSHWGSQKSIQLFADGALVESHCLLLCFVFELYGAFVAEGRMPADGIIKAIDISGDGIFGLVW